MTIEEAKTYLMSQSGSGGIIDPTLRDRATFALELGYSEVWGSYAWKVRRKSTTLTTTAAQASDNLPSDFEMAIWMGVQESGRQRYIAIREEELFDLGHPMPANDANGLPIDCKIVYNLATPATSWKVHWWRVPDAAYTIPLSYHRSADVEFLPKLPSHMLPAVLASALAFFKGNVAERQAYNQMAEIHLMKAQVAEKTVSGVFPIFGDNQGWDDFENHSGISGSTFNPLDWGRHF